MSPLTPSLAPGFRFHPTDEELVTYYLKRKACDQPFHFPAISDLDVYKSQPWDLSGYSSLKTRDMEWYFFSPVDKKYGNGGRVNRSTALGYWKSTGNDRCVRHKAHTVGLKKTLVYHHGRAPGGQRTNWLMHEYRLTDQDLGKAGVVQDAFVLCRIFQKSRLGPPIADCYAPFLDEEWNDDDVLFVPENDPVLEPNPIDQESDGKLERSSEEDDCGLEPISSSETKKAKTDDDNDDKTVYTCEEDDNNCENVNNNGSQNSTTTSSLPKATVLEFPLLDNSIHPKDSTASACMFDASNLEKSVPPGLLEYIGNLEKEILNVSLERETMKLEVMRAKAMINILESRVECVTRENNELRSQI